MSSTEKKATNPKGDHSVSTQHSARSFIHQLNLYRLILRTNNLLFSLLVIMKIIPYQLVIPRYKGINY